MAHALFNELRQAYGDVDCLAEDHLAMEALQVLLDSEWCDTEPLGPWDHSVPRSTIAPHDLIPLLQINVAHLMRKHAHTTEGSEHDFEALGRALWRRRACLLDMGETEAADSAFELVTEWLHESRKRYGVHDVRYLTVSKVAYTVFELSHASSSSVSEMSLSEYTFV